MKIEAGKVLSQRYRLIRPLGQGSQASVWIAEHLALSTQVAVKLIDPELAKKDDARERFRREATAAAQLRSSHVVQILDHGIEGDQPFIVMELMEGEDLFERLEKRGRISLQETSRIVTQVSRALTRAHAAGIVHRDLKPENFFLVHNEDDEVVKVLDFGVAKVSSPAQQTMRRTGVGTLIGTPHYMSPEQVKGIGEVDFRTDLWALGVIVYQCVTGDLPFDSEGVGDLLIKISVGEMPVPSKVVPDLPPAFDAWFAKACDRDAMQRFASARDLAEALARVAGLSTETSSTTGDSVVARLPALMQQARDSTMPAVPAPPAAPTPALDEDWGPEPEKAPPKEPAKKEVARDEPPPAQGRPAPRRPPPRRGVDPVPAATKPAAANRPAVAASKPAAAAEAPTSLDSSALEEVSEEHADEIDEVEEVAADKESQQRPSTPPRPAFESQEVSFESEAPPPNLDVGARVVEPAGIPPAPLSPRLALPVRPPVEAPRISVIAARPPPSTPASSDARGGVRSTVSGVSSMTPSPEFDGGSRRRRMVRWLALALIALAGAVIWNVVRSQIPPTPPANAVPPAPSREPEPPPPQPADTPSTSASVQAVDPGRLSSGVAPQPAPPKPTTQPGRPVRKKDDMEIEIPLPPDD